MKVDLERFKKLRTGTPHYQGCLDSIVKELAAAREVVRTARIVSFQQREWIEKNTNPIRAAVVINTNIEHMGRKVDIYDEVIGVV